MPATMDNLASQGVDLTELLLEALPGLERPLKEHCQACRDTKRRLAFLAAEEVLPCNHRVNQDIGRLKPLSDGSQDSGERQLNSVEVSAA